MKKRVLLGMSGGVDSSVSALLLQKEGYEVIGATMKLWMPNKEDGTEFDYKYIEDAKKICEQLGIKHYVVDLREQFKGTIVDRFIKEYESGRTPNPCIDCNKWIKFGKLFGKARELGCEYIATGHYARKVYSEKYKKDVIVKSKAIRKDQTYFLYQVNKHIVDKMLFPLQEFSDKSEIRQIAKENKLIVANKAESQEICFIPDKNYAQFLLKHMKEKPKPGNIVLTTGEVVGVHEGLIFYTVGQRKGIKVPYTEPLYVVKLDSEKNELVVGVKEDLLSKELYASSVNWIAIDPPKEPVEVFARHRYGTKEAKALVYPEGKKVRVVFEEPQRAITTEQSVVFYDEDGVLIGGGKID